MVELKLYTRTAISAPSSITSPHELLEVVRNRAALRRASSWRLIHCDDLLSPTDLLLLPLLASDEESSDFIRT